MTLLFIDSWDHYDTGDLALKWTGGSGAAISAGNGRNGTDALLITGGGANDTVINLGAQTVWVIGFAIKFTSFAVADFLALFDAATIQIQLQINADRTISIKRGGTALATSGLSLAVDTWYFLELKVLIDNAVGTIDLRVNEISWISEINQDTQVSGNNSANQIWFRSDSTNIEYYVDDLHVMNDSGAVNNDFIGDHRVEALLPDAAGNVAEWDRFPDVGEANWDDVDENPADDDATYTHQDTAGLPQQDTHEMEDLITTAGVVVGVQTLLDARKDDAAAVTINPTIRSGGADYQRTSYNLTDSYLYNLEIEEADPDTAAAWLIAAINSVELGYRRTA